MDRKFKSGAAVGAPALDNASDGFATNGNPGGGVPATVPGAHWYHMITEELLALIADAAIAFDKTVLTQVRDAVRALVAAAAMPMSEMTFKIANNGVDATNDIDISAGKCRSSDDTVNLSGGAMTKQLDAVWAAGTNAGGRCSGEALANGTWHVYAFKRTTGGAGIDYCFSQLTNPVLPDTAVKARRVGSILREGAVIVAFSQLGDEFLRNAAILDTDVDNPGNAAVDRTLSVPTGIVVHAILHVVGTAAAGTDLIAGLSPKAISDQAPSASVAPLATAISNNGVGYTASGVVRLRTDTTGKVRSRLQISAAGVILRVATLGWVDRRGRDG